MDWTEYPISDSHEEDEAGAHDCRGCQPAQDPFAQVPHDL